MQFPTIFTTLAETLPEISHSFKIDFLSVFQLTQNSSATTSTRNLKCAQNAQKDSDDCEAPAIIIHRFAIHSALELRDPNETF